MTLPKYAMNQSSFPELHEQELVGPLFRPFAELTIDRLRPGAEDSLLDIACGTGIVARLAKARMARGRVVGVDLSADMLRVAASVEPRIDWREGNAVALPIEPDETFDLVVCQQGLQFVPDKQSAVAEMRRATKAGGSLAVSTWREDEEIRFSSSFGRSRKGTWGQLPTNATASATLTSSRVSSNRRAFTMSPSTRSPAPSRSTMARPSCG